MRWRLLLVLHVFGPLLHLLFHTRSDVVPCKTFHGEHPESGHMQSELSVYLAWKAVAQVKTTWTPVEVCWKPFFLGCDFQGSSHVISCRLPDPTPPWWLRNQPTNRPGNLLRGRSVRPLPLVLSKLWAVPRMHNRRGKTLHLPDSCVSSSPVVPVVGPVALRVLVVPVTGRSLSMQRLIWVFQSPV